MNETGFEFGRECETEESNCKYSTTSLYCWLLELKMIKGFFIVTPLVLGGFATMEILKDSSVDWVKPAVALSALLAGIIPSIYTGLSLDSTIKDVKKSAGLFKILEGKFRRLRNSTMCISKFEETIKLLEETQKACPAIPEKHFNRARKKIVKYRGDQDE